MEILSGFHVQHVYHTHVLVLHSSYQICMSYAAPGTSHYYRSTGSMHCPTILQYLFYSTTLASRARRRVFLFSSCENMSELSNGYYSTAGCTVLCKHGNIHYIGNKFSMTY